MKKTAILLIALMVVSVGFLSGCNEQSGTIGDTDKVKITERSVSTSWTERTNTTWIGGYPHSDYKDVVNDGFFHSYPHLTGTDDEILYICYRVSGHVENIAGKYLDIVNITALFLGSNGETLAKETDLIYDLPQDRMVSFYISLDRDDTYYFDEIVDVRFEVSAS